MSLQIDPVEVLGFTWFTAPSLCGYSDPVAVARAWERHSQKTAKV